ncbi:MAG: response regulator transcription factor [Gorillibacterium sp.]|nr:response regulator transcription factor [Gorillibacterium sp.]
MNKKKILVVDDEPSIAMLLNFNLKLAGYEVQCVYDGEAVFEVLAEFRPDLIVLDLMLPKLSGIEVCRRLRRANNLVPVIMLTALQGISEKIAGLDNGADDYMTKPFSPQELLSRIQAILRRVENQPNTTSTEDFIEIGDMKIIPASREVSMKSQSVELTPKEYELLHFLSRHRGKALTRQQLLHGVWDYHFLGDTRIVDVHISHLRDKIENNPRRPDYVVTVRSVGYKLAEPSLSKSLSSQAK